MSLPNSQAPDEALSRLLQESALVWRGGAMAQPPAQSTGFAALDERLPGGGWPIGSLIEIARTCDGVGELSLTVPLLRSLARAGRSVVLISPPHTPYAPAFAAAGLPLKSLLWVHADSDEDARWSSEQILREGLAGAILLWSSTADDRSVRRLQIAAETGKSFAFIYRPASTLGRSSPAALRIALSPAAEGIRAEILKVRGGRPSGVTLALQSAFT